MMRENFERRLHDIFDDSDKFWSVRELYVEEKINSLLDHPSIRSYVRFHRIILIGVSPYNTEQMSFRVNNEFIQTFRYTASSVLFSDALIRSYELDKIINNK